MYKNASRFEQRRLHSPVLYENADRPHPQLVDPPSLESILIPLGALLIAGVATVGAVGYVTVKIVGGTIRLGKRLFGRGRPEDAAA